MRSPLRQILRPARCHLRQTRQHKLTKQLRQQIILAILMNILFRALELQQMMLSRQAHQMSMQQLMDNNTLIRG